MNSSRSHQSQQGPAPRSQSFSLVCAREQYGGPSDPATPGQLDANHARNSSDDEMEVMSFRERPQWIALRKYNEDDKENILFEHPEGQINDHETQMDVKLPDFSPTTPQPRHETQDRRTSAASPHHSPTPPQHQPRPPLHPPLLRLPPTIAEMRKKETLSPKWATATSSQPVHPTRD
jgi:hypothetical protein